MTSYNLHKYSPYLLSSVHVMDDVRFIPYEHIDNGLEKTIELAKKEYADVWQDENWVATEKIHGTNFQIITDGQSIQCASRNRLLKNTDSFHGFTSIVEKYSRAVKSMLNDVQTLMPEADGLMRVYGELFGGIYDDKGKGAIQKEIKYIPYKDFYLFDISLDDQFIDIEDLIKLAQKYDFKFYSKILAEGELKDLLKLDPNFYPNIPIEEGLGTLSENFAEGFVLRPRKNFRKSPFKLKYKNPKFDESRNQKTEKPVKASGGDANVSPLFQEYKNLVVGGASDHRVTSLFSKFTKEELSNMKIAKMAQMVIKDVVDEYRIEKQEFTDIYNEIPEKSRRALEGKAIPEIIPFVKFYLSENN